MSFAAAFKRAGLRPWTIDFKIALARAQNNGGTYDEVREIVDAAYGMPGEGHRVRADEAVPVLPSARQPNGDDEAIAEQPEGRVWRAKSFPPQGDGAGHHSHADEGQDIDARPSPTEAARALRAIPRHPSSDQIRAQGEARKMAAAVILKIDGDDVRDLTVGRCRSLLARSRTESYVLSVIVGKLKHLPDDIVVGSILNDEDLKSIAAQGKEFGNAQ